MTKTTKHPSYHPRNVSQIFRPRRYIGYGAALLIVAILPMHAFGQNNVLNAENLTSVFADGVESNFSKKKPKKGTFLEVVGDFSLLEPEGNSVSFADISLIISTTVDGKVTTQQFEPKGVGLGDGLGIREGRKYFFAEELPVGKIGGSYKSGACQLKKATREAKADLVMTKDPSKLFLVFDVAKEQKAKYALKIGDRKFFVQRPPSNTK